MVAGPGVARDPAGVLERVLDTARHDDFEGYSKHDALNAPLAREARRASRGPAGSWPPSS